jgi:hypothetical protein
VMTLHHKRSSSERNIPGGLDSVDDMAAVAAFFSSSEEPPMGFPWLPASFQSLFQIVPHIGSWGDYAVPIIALRALRRLALRRRAEWDCALAAAVDERLAGARLFVPEKSAEEGLARAGVGHKSARRVGTASGDNRPGSQAGDDQCSSTCRRHHRRGLEFDARSRDSARRRNHNTRGPLQSDDERKERATLPLTLVPSHSWYRNDWQTPAWYILAIHVPSSHLLPARNDKNMLENKGQKRSRRYVSYRC